MLLDHIKENPYLIFKDLQSLRSLRFEELSISGFAFEEFPKSLAILYLDNSLNSLEAFFGFYASKHAVALLSSTINETIKRQLEVQYAPKLIYDQTRTTIEGYELENCTFVNASSENYQIAPELKLLLSTSGTTGSPKFVKLSDKNLLENARSILAYLPIKNSDVCPLNLPIYYSYGLSILTTNCIGGGTVICGTKDILNKDFWVDFEQNAFTSLAGVPYVYEVLNRIGFLNKTYPSLRYFTQAGGKLNETQVRKFSDYAIEHALDFYVMYGQTEATARMSFLNVGAQPMKIGSVGKAIEKGSFVIEPESHELRYSGPNVFGGYAEKIKDLSHFEYQNTLLTGDLASMDKDGYVYITGRIKRFVKIIGLRINLDEVEQILKAKFPQATFVCAGKDDQFLYIVCTNTTVEKAAVLTVLKELMNVHPSFIKYKFQETLPLTANGKVNYTAIIE